MAQVTGPGAGAGTGKAGRTAGQPIPSARAVDLGDVDTHTHVHDSTGGPEPFAASAMPPKTDVKKAPRIKVRATADGFYDNRLYRQGDVFFIDGTLFENVPVPKDELDPDPLDERFAATSSTGKADRVPPRQRPERRGKVAAFSRRWMEVVPSDTPIGITSNNDVLRKQHDEEANARMERIRAAASTADNPLGADE